MRVHLFIVWKTIYNKKEMFLLSNDYQASATLLSSLCHVGMKTVSIAKYISYRQLVIYLFIFALIATFLVYLAFYCYVKVIL